MKKNNTKSADEQKFFEDNFDSMERLGPDYDKKVRARNKAFKESRINMRVDPDDLEMLKTVADEKRIPYQTLLGHVIHEYVKGNLVDAKEIAKIFKKRAG